MCTSSSTIENTPVDVPAGLYNKINAPDCLRVAYFVSKVTKEFGPSFIGKTITY